MLETVTDNMFLILRTILACLTAYLFFKLYRRVKHNSVLFFAIASFLTVIIRFALLGISANEIPGYELLLLAIELLKTLAAYLFVKASEKFIKDA